MLTNDDTQAPRDVEQRRSLRPREVDFFTHPGGRVAYVSGPPPAEIYCDKGGIENLRRNLRFYKVLGEDLAILSGAEEVRGGVA